ncbi:serine/threonine-protein kinase [Clostridium sp. C8-1-8]|uniref:serine/threonine-protein kinase n=1 Tax=Clostridium sp. C8-1-8 TaxID=2698831 RepID=UPI001368059D|nr:serine/threonine-protein kinase [Clostridium sp. C8-1-8]
MLAAGYVLDNKYKIIKVLGKGGMGTVYLCENIRLNNLWAIKETKRNDKLDMNLISEANILKKLNNPGIPRVIDVFYEQDFIYMVEDYVEGQTLFDYINSNDVSDLESIIAIILQVCDIIKYLHSFTPAIIYRDLKPSNIMITKENSIILIDFGISRIYKFDKDTDTVSMGSSGYAAPEQHGAMQSCIQTDIYGIGMVMYFMVTKKVPFSGAEPLIDENYGKAVDQKLIKIIQKCVQVNIKDRYSSVVELRNELIQLSNDNYYEKTSILLNNDTTKIEEAKDIKSKKINKFIIAIPLLVILVLTSLYFLNQQENELNNSKLIDNATSVDNSNNKAQEARDPKEQVTDSASNKSEVNTDYQKKDGNTSVTDQHNSNNSQVLSNTQKGKGHSKKKK